MIEFCTYAMEMKMLGQVAFSGKLAEANASIISLFNRKISECVALALTQRFLQFHCPNT